MFKITLPIPNTPGITLTLVGIVSMRVFNNISERLGVTPTEAIQKLQDKINEVLPQCKALPTTLGDSNRFLFIPFKVDNPDLGAPLDATKELVDQVLKEFPEITPPDVSTEEELFHYVIPDFTIIH